MCLGDCSRLGFKRQDLSKSQVDRRIAVSNGFTSRRDEAREAALLSPSPNGLRWSAGTFTDSLGRPTAFLYSLTPWCNVVHVDGNVCQDGCGAALLVNLAVLTRVDDQR